MCEGCWALGTGQRARSERPCLLSDVSYLLPELARVRAVHTCLVPDVSYLLPELAGVRGVHVALRHNVRLVEALQEKNRNVLGFS